MLYSYSDLVLHRLNSLLTGHHNTKPSFMFVAYVHNRCQYKYSYSTALWIFTCTLHRRAPKTRCQYSTHSIADSLIFDTDVVSLSTSLAQQVLQSVHLRVHHSVLLHQRAQCLRSHVGLHKQKKDSLKKFAAIYRRETPQHFRWKNTKSDKKYNIRTVLPPCNSQKNWYTP